MNATKRKYKTKECCYCHEEVFETNMLRHMNTKHSELHEAEMKKKRRMNPPITSFFSTATSEASVPSSQASTSAALCKTTSACFSQADSAIEPFEFTQGTSAEHHEHTCEDFDSVDMGLVSHESFAVTHNDYVDLCEPSTNLQSSATGTSSTLPEGKEEALSLLPKASFTKLPPDVFSVSSSLIELNAFLHHAERLRKCLPNVEAAAADIIQIAERNECHNCKASKVLGKF
jgi:hypothetical protein